MCKLTWLHIIFRVIDRFDFEYPLQYFASYKRENAGWKAYLSGGLNRLNLPEIEVIGAADYFSTRQK